MMPHPVVRHIVTALACTAVTAASARPASAQPPPFPSVYDGVSEPQLSDEISTNAFLEVLKTPGTKIYDVRTAKEYAIAHIPGTINVYELEVDQIIRENPDHSSAIVLYCNGPSCGKSKRTAESLHNAGYTNVRRYQLGMPVWRALSFTVQTDMPGFDYIIRGDRTAVFVDARTPAEHAAGTIPGAVNVQKGEATAANDDGRLPFTDKGTRVVVFGNTAEQARIVAAEIAKKAYWNSSYFGGTLADLLAAGYVNHPPVSLTRNATIPAGPACTADVPAAAVDGGSFDADGDTVSLSVEDGTALGLGQHTVSLVATDSRGASSAATAVVTIADQSGPVISNLAVDKEWLWPPNGKLQLVTVNYTAVDNCGSVTTELLVATDSRDSHRTDARVVDAHHVQLAADLGDGERLTYVITVVATDAAGNRSDAPIFVRVGLPR